MKKKRSWILYGTAVATLFLTAACWTLLPAQVVMQAAAVGQAVNAVCVAAEGGRLRCGAVSGGPAAALPAAGQSDGVIWIWKS